MFNDPAYPSPTRPSDDVLTPAGDVTLVLEALRRGEMHASTELLPLVYEELRRHAHRRMHAERNGQTLQPTALVHEAWLQLFRRGDQTWANRAHFFGAAAEAMRRILIDHARRKARVRHGGGQERISLDGAEPTADLPAENLLQINEALEKLEAIDPLKARIVTLKFFGGLTHPQVAETLDLTERTVERHWSYAKAWLFQAMRNEAN